MTWMDINDPLQAADNRIPITEWLPRPSTVTLGNNEVHVWRGSLDTVSCTEDLQQVLSSDEQDRCKRYYFDRDRTRFIVSRGLLRMILGRYVDKAPDRLRFCYSSYGKPVLADEVDQCGIRFNLSHSDGLVLYAITYGRQVGVDVERLQPSFAGLDIAKHYFSPSEVTVLLALPESLRLKAFFNCWTRKEAYIKARGEGLTLPLDRFDVSLAPGENAALLRTYDDPQEASRWSLRDLHPGPDYAGALAVEGHDWQLKCWQW